MKKILQSVAVALTLLVANNAQAQLPNNGIYPGGLMLDSYQPSAGYSGNLIYTMGTWDIDSILDSGTPVILDLFASWCGPCWSYHTGGTLEALYDSQGWGGPGNVAIFGVESDANTPATKLEGGDQGDWINNTKYPMVNHNTVASMFNLAYYPTLVLICPDRQVTEVGQTTEANWTTAIQGCAAPASYANDPKVLTIDPINKAICQQTTASVNISITIQNYSTAAINGAYDIEITDASNAVVANTTANLNLQPYAVQTVMVGSVTSNIGTNNYTAKITTPNDDLTNDTQPVVVNVNAATTLQITPDMNVRIELNMDNYASEVGFALREGVPAGDAAAEWTAANAGNSIAYKAAGSMADGTTTFGQDYTINNYGCHFFVTHDDYGDGITYSNPSGNAKLISQTTDVIPGNWGDGMVKAYDFTCTNATYNDVITTCGSYTWIDGNTYTSSNNTATYTAANTVGGTCDSVYTLDLTIINNIDLTTSITGNGITINAAANGATYQWLDCSNGSTPISGETNQTFTATTNGDYACIISYNGGCSDTTNCVSIVSVGLEENVSNNTFVIYPNPVNENANVKFELETEANVTISIVNTLGQTVYNNQLGNVNGTQNVQINTTDLQEGIYLVNVTVNGNTTTQRISIVK